MARIRTVKPELFRHENLFTAEQETGLPLRLSFIGLLTVCDREGRFRWLPNRIKLDVLPYDTIDFSRVLDALSTRGFLVKYALGSDVYGCIPSFGKHQHINNRECLSVLPGVSDEGIKIYGNNDIDASSTRADRASNMHVQDQGEYGIWNMEYGRERIPPTAVVRDMGKKPEQKHLSSDGFDEFYAQYPKKVARKTAEKSWKNKQLSGKTELIVADVVWRKANDHKWLSGFIPNPTTYLNQERWTDERITPEQAQQRCAPAKQTMSAPERVRLAYERQNRERKQASRTLDNQDFVAKDGKNLWP